jgi:hypothetical protein
VLPVAARQQSHICSSGFNFFSKETLFLRGDYIYKKEVAEKDAETISYLWVSRVLKSVAKLATLNFYNFLLFLVFNFPGNGIKLFRDVAD